MCLRPRQSHCSAYGNIIVLNGTLDEQSSGSFSSASRIAFRPGTDVCRSADTHSFRLLAAPVACKRTLIDNRIGGSQREPGERLRRHNEQ